MRSMSVKKRAISMALCLICTLSVIMSGTLTWLATTQAVNSFSGTKGDYSVTLEKKEKDLTGAVTGNRVANAEFYLYRITNANPEETEQIGGRYVTNANGIINVDGLVAGAYYFLETSVPYSYDYDKEADGVTPKKRYDFDISSAATANVRVEAFNVKKESELEVTKRIENHDGSEVTDAQKVLTFTFKITFSDGKTYPYVIGSGSEQTLDNGTFTLKHGETAIFKGVPIGVMYNVIEEPSPKGEYIISSDNHTGHIRAEDNKATFVNNFVDDQLGSLTISKTVTGTDKQEDLNAMFSFVVKLGEDPEIVYPYHVHDETGKIGEGEIKSGNTIQLKHGQWAIFPELAIGLDYQVNEDNKEGFIQQVTEKKGEIIEGGVRADFINTKEEEEKLGNLIVTKTVEIVPGASLVDKDGNPIPNPMEKVFHFTIRVGNDTYTCDLKHGQTYRINNIPIGTDYEVVEDDYYAEGYITSSTNTNATIVEGDNHAGVKNVFDNPSDEEKYGKLRLEKHVVGGDNNKEFIFHVKIGNNASREVKLKNGEFFESEEFLVGTHYQIYEENYYADGYITTSVGAMGTIIEAGALAVYTNTYEDRREYGTLEISKVISGTGINASDEERDFTFNISFSDGKTYSYELTDKDGNKTTHSLTAGKFTIKNGEKATFKNLPVGIVYEVVEEAVEGYLQGLIKQTGVVVKDTIIKAPYNNYKQQLESKIIVKKITTGEGADLEKSFDFVVTSGDKTHEFSLKNGEEKEIEVMVGDHYEVSEKDYFTDGYILKSIQNGYGTVTKEIIEAIAENAYIGEVPIDLIGTKTWNVPAGMELPEEITVYLKNGDLVVLEAKASADTNWEYTFLQVPKYDEDGVEIVYTVEEEAIAGFIAEVDGLNLTNTYIDPVVIESPEVEKRIRVIGEGNPREATFAFILTGEGNAPMPIEANGNKKEVHLNGEGSVYFGDIQFTLPGTYTYTIEEVIGTASGYTYDATKYTYTVVVEVKEDELVATETLSIDAEEFEKAIFVNLFTPEDKDKTSLTVRKVWAGVPSKELQPESIKVQLYKNAKAEGEAVILNAENEWTHTWSELAKDVNWSVDELEVPKDFAKVISISGETGYTITNTYNSGTPTPTPKPGDPTSPPTGGGNPPGGKVITPKTDDPMARGLWITILVASAAGLAVVLALSKKDSKKKLNNKKQSL